MMERVASVLRGRRIGVIVTAALLAVSVGAAFQPPAASAANDPIAPVAVFSPVFVRDAASVTLSVTTDSAAKCVTVAGAHNATKTNNGSASWSFTFAASAGDGTKTVTVRAFSNANCNGGGHGSDDASYIVDNTVPTITGSRTPAANAEGWNNSDVAVNFACSDAGGSGIDSCVGSTTLTTDGNDQSVSGTATDKAGNTSTGTVGGIRIDKKAPSLSGAPTTAANGSGWYSGDVAIRWTCSDALSGLDGVCPADSTIASEGGALAASSSVKDLAGNSTTASSPAVKIDRHAPVTTASAPAAWNNTNVTVALDARDVLSGVAATSFQLDDGPVEKGDSVSISAEGDHTLAFWSIDEAGNEEAHNEVHVKIDKTPPTIGHTQNPGPNGKGWNNTDVTVTFSCDDHSDLAGIASCTAPQTVRGEGANQTVTGRAVDNAGNTATDPATVSIDKTAPEISGAADRAANDAGWYDKNVTVLFECDDALSGIADCPSAATVDEGANQSATGTAKDAAGNEASATVSGVNVDTTPPAVSGSPTTDANSDGWYSGPVTIHWTCDDNLSGLAGECPADSIIGGGGTGLTTGVTVADEAGNVTVATSPAVKIDLETPTTTSDVPSGWQSGAFEVHFAGRDALSGLRTTYFTVNGGDPQEGISVPIATTGLTTLTFWSEDIAGNAETARSVTVQLDNAAPTIKHVLAPPANAEGWNNADVTVTFTCEDQIDLSGLESCTGGRSVASETDGQDVPGEAKDFAGNTATDTVKVKLDKTPPTIDATVDREPNSNEWYQSDVTVSYTCDDNLSGVATCPQAQTLGEGAGQESTGQVLDIADNSASASIKGINVDKTPPTVTGAATSQPTNDWYRGDVAIHWTCTDPLSGLDGLCPADSTIIGEGSTLSATEGVSDRAGNETRTTVGGIKIDRTAPTTSASAPSRWVNGKVTVTLDAKDTLSGVAGTYYRLDGAAAVRGTSLEIDAEGTHTVEYWSVDNAGNAEQPHAATVQIDKTRADDRGQPEPGEERQGLEQHRRDGLVHLRRPGAAVRDRELHDAPDVDGRRARPGGEGRGDRQRGQQGRHHSLGGHRHDQPDDRRRHGPRRERRRLVQRRRSPCPSRAVTRSSGIAQCASPVTLGEGADQAANGTAIDAADNSASATVSDLNVDTTQPTITGAPTSTPTADGWFNHDVVVEWTCADQVGLSGFAEGACPATTKITGEGDSLSATASVSDQAGNEASGLVGGIKIDRVAPTTTASAPTSWVNKATVTLIATDGASGVANTFYRLDSGADTAGTSVLLEQDGTHILEFWSVDKAGNIEPVKTVTVRIDGTGPTIEWPGGPDGAATYAFGTVPAATTCTAIDATSGPGDCTVSGYGTTVGQHTMTATATDIAGNQTTESRTYTVKEAYTLKGFYQPVDVGQVLNTVKGGSTVPLKFEVFAGSKELTDTAIVASFTARSIPCSATLPTDDLTAAGTAIGTSLRYDGDQFHQNWQTPKTAGICYQVKVTTTDGSSISALFKLK